MTEAAGEIRAGRRQQRVAARWQAGDRLSDVGEEPVVEFGVQRQQEPGAVSEVVEERSLRDAGLLNDEVDAHASQPGLLGQAQSGLDEVLARGGPTLLPRAHRLP